MRLRMINGGWDDSRLRRCLEDVKDAVAAKGGISSLILEANIDTISKENLATDLASGDMDEAIAKRYNTFGMMKSLFRLALLDSKETLDRKKISFGGLGEVLAVLMEWTAGASGILMTRIFGVITTSLKPAMTLFSSWPIGLMLIAIRSGGRLVMMILPARTRWGMWFHC
ncbi:anti-CBASS protein Acb1 family protein [Yersinia aldovae]|uniref:anti-CBASS protein Acb1 family protein n=1 Tax=Yersinia aldovae TaxID=29483 RepID=UPI0005AD2369|nr:hypothetical protein AT01_713 [Yersinia aldovae 670-83]